ncbi:MAG: ABC transporter permease subunit [Chloroflexi bacterium]|nr:ABC transporter permease subunit [Chloroflexota bacterium]
MATLSKPANLPPAVAARPGVRARIAYTLGNALIVTRREVRDSLRDWRIMVPIFLLTLIFPLLANAMTRLFIGFFEKNGAEPLLPSLLPLMPMIVGFFPVSISLVIALETFVGEKERLSLEPLLSTPLTNTELYLGKAFAAMLPPLMASYTGLTIYISGLVFGAQQWRPPLMLIVQIVCLTTVQALVMVTGAVVVSSQTTSTRAANLLSSFIIIPVSMLVMLESVIMVQPHQRYLLWYIVLGLLVTVVLLIRMGARIFNREELLGRSLDHISLRWAWRTFWDQVRGPVGESWTLKRWYQLSVFPAVRRLRQGMGVVLIGLVAAFIAGWIIAGSWDVPLDQFEANDATLLENLQSWFELGQSRPGLIVLAVVQNLRALILATLLAIFTFGVMSLVVTMIPFAVLGFILALVAASNLSPLPFFMAVIPHGIVEIPAIVLAGAAALRLGSVVTRPPDGLTVGEAWLRALGDTVKIGVGVVTPLILVAGILEVVVTPRVVELILTL